MTATPDATAAGGRLDLEIVRTIDVRPDLVWRAWTDPELLKQWWSPKPWTTPECEIDLRPGSNFRFLMRGPDGPEQDLAGCILEVVERRRIVWTLALTAGWRPAEDPFMVLTAIITLEPEGDGTRYTAHVLHRSDADRQRHEEMGFHEGWNTCIDQLAEVAGRLGGTKA